MPTSTPVNRKDLEARIVARARQDEAFRQELLSHPTETILKELGLNHTPDGLRFEVLEETCDNLYIVLPPSPDKVAAMAGGQGALTDEELDHMRQSQPIVILKCSCSRGHCDPE
jgi:hypothetical protein